MVFIVAEEEFPDLPYGWEARGSPPKGRHATYLQKLKLKFECPICSGKKSNWTSMKVCFKMTLYLYFLNLF
jgi:hypothetical protein